MASLHIELVRIWMMN